MLYTMLIINLFLSKCLTKENTSKILVIIVLESKEISDPLAVSG